MLDEKTIEQELKENTDMLLSYLNDIDDELLLVHPSENVWSMMQCYEHILILELAIKNLLRGKTEKCERNPTEMVEKIKYRFSDYDRKYTAGERIRPKGIIKDKEVMQREFQNNRKELLTMLKNGSLQELCLDYPHAIFGTLTRIEWYYFCIFHAERHLHQMKEIEDHLPTHHKRVRL